MRRLRLVSTAVLIAAGCVPQPSARSGPQGLTPAVIGVARAGPAARNPSLLGNGKIQHVVIIFQENRSTDNLFNGLPGADTIQSGLNSAGQRIKLVPVSLSAPYDIDHEHRAFVTAYDDGAMDGFNLERSNCTSNKKCPEPDVRAYGFVPHDDIKPYLTMAREYAFADHMFQTNQGPSFAAHQYIVSGTSTVTENSSVRAAELPFSPRQKYTGGCDSPQGSLVTLIDAKGAESTEAYPCFDRPALTDLIDAKSLSWHYYLAHGGPGLWNAPDAIKHIRESSEYSADVTAPSSQVLTDVASNELADVVWVMPTPKESDHAGVTNGSGPDWVASVVNAIGESSYWKNTVIFVTWDDWGGWYDHIKPDVRNSYELGFRVPLIAISPYSKAGYISTRQHEFGSILKFVEKAFALGSLGSTDVHADDFADCFDFAQKPRAFTPIPTKHSAAYFLHQPMSDEEADTDF